MKKWLRLRSTGWFVKLFISLLSNLNMFSRTAAYFLLTDKLNNTFWVAHMNNTPVTPKTPMLKMSSKYCVTNSLLIIKALSHTNV